MRTGPSFPVGVLFALLFSSAMAQVAPTAQRYDPRLPQPRHAYSPYDAMEAEKGVTPAPKVFSPQRVLIKLKPEALATASGPQKMSGAVFGVAGLGMVQRTFPTATAPIQKASSSGAQTPETPDLRLWLEGEVLVGSTVEKVAEDLLKNPQVAAAEPDFLFRLADGSPVASASGDAGGQPRKMAASNDPLATQQWHLDAAGIPQAWTYLQSQNINPGGRRDVVIAVIDTGVDYTHQDLAANMWRNLSETPNDGLDNDGNGVVDDIHGANFVGGGATGNPMDDQGHGTHVAGIIGAVSGNGLGGVGVAYNCQIMAIKAANSSGQLSATDIARALQYAVQMGADVINMSFGGSSKSQVVEDALKLAAQKAVLVAAAGNSSKPSELPALGPRPFYPASYNFVLGVMAQMKTPLDGHYLAAFSNWDSLPGTRVEYELMAPGTAIQSTLPGDKYAAWNGTSMASPVVAGVAALVRSLYNDRTTHAPGFIAAQVLGSAMTNPLLAITPPEASPLSYPSLNGIQSMIKAPAPNLSYLEHYVFDTKAVDAANDADGILDAGETVDLALVLRNNGGKANPVVVRLEAKASPSAPADPYVTWITSEVDYGAIGDYNEDDNGLQYTNGLASGVAHPFRFKIAANAPNDYFIPIQVTITATNGYGSAVSQTVQTLRFGVQNGRTLPSVITADLTMGPDTYWIIDRACAIPEGVTVRVLPGTQIQFYSSESISPYPTTPYPFWLVNGSLLIEGTADSPVDIFPSLQHPDWIVSIMQGGDPAKSSAILRYVRLQNPFLGADYTGLANPLPVNEMAHSLLFSKSGHIMNPDQHTMPIVNVRNVDTTIIKNLGKYFPWSSFVPQMSSPEEGFQLQLNLMSKVKRSLFDSCRVRTANRSEASKNVFLLNANQSRDTLAYSGSAFMANGGMDLSTYLRPHQSIFTRAGHSYVLARGVSIADFDALMRSLGGYRVCLNDRDETEALLRFYEGNWRIPGGSRVFMVGYNDFDGDGNYTWEDGSSGGYLGNEGVVFDEKVNNPWVRLYYDGNTATPYMNLYYQGGSYFESVYELPRAITLAEFDTARLEFIRTNYGMKGSAILNQWWRTTDTLKYWMNFFGSTGGQNLTQYITNNYWGGATPQLVEKAIYDQTDIFSFNDIVFEPMLTTAPADVWPFVVDVKLASATGTELTKVGAERVTFTVTFNRDMNPARQPKVTFGPGGDSQDYSANRVLGAWQNARTWVGSFPFTTTTGDGYQLIKITDAVAADDPWLVTGNDAGRFRFEVVTSGVESLNLQAVGSEGKVELSWMQDDFELLAGYNLYRSTSETGTYTRINGTIIPADTRVFRDVLIEPGRRYYYYFTVVQTDTSESNPSNIAQATPTDTIPPVITHTPISEAEPNAGITFNAVITDNVAVTGATLFHRRRGTTTWESRAMINLSGSQWTVALEGGKVIYPGVEYYLVASDGTTQTSFRHAESPAFINVADKPVITDVSPREGPIAGGTAVTLTGSNFKTGDRVFFGTVEATNVVIVSPTQITCRTAVSIPVRVSVRVEGANGSSGSLLNAFTYIDTNARVYLAQVSGNPGATVSIPVEIANAGGLVAARMVLTYDPAVLRFVRGAATSYTAGWTFVVNPTAANQITLALASGQVPAQGSGTLAKLDFEVLGTAGQLSALTLSGVTLNGGALVPQIIDGAVTVSAGFTISGQVRFWNGARPIAGVALGLEGAGLINTTSGTDGTYSFTSLGAVAFRLTPALATQLDGISAYDAALVLRRSVGLESFTGDAFTAADVNRDNDVTPMDAHEILKHAAGLGSINIPSAGQPWIFTPASRTYAVLTANQLNQDFVAILRGDVSGNWGTTGVLSGLIAKTGLVRVTDTLANRTLVYVLLQSGALPIYGVDLLLAYGAGATLDSVSAPTSTSAVRLSTPGRIQAALASAEGLRGDQILFVATFQGTADPGVSLVSLALNEGQVLATEDANPAAFDHDGDGTIDPIGAPVIKTQPASVSANVGDAVAFTVVVAGNPSPTYQWRKDGQPLPGATNARLAIASAQAMHAGTYVVVVSNPQGQVTSSSATLTLNLVPSAPVIITQPAGLGALLGGTARFSVVAGGYPLPSYQWRKDGVVLSGATRAVLEVGPVQASHAGSYTVDVSNSVGTVTSQAAALVIMDVRPEHGVSGGTYSPGTAVTITNTLTYAGTLSSLGWQVLVPPGWSYAGGAGSQGEVSPRVGTTNLLEWAWTTIPASPVRFSYTLTPPATASGPVPLAALVIARQSGAALQVTARPDPLILNDGGHHSADADRNYRLSLLELTRVIELYNTRQGTARTGRYKVAIVTTEDGFAPDLSSLDPAAVPALPARFHSGDINRDGQLSLLELTRIIEFYNQRTGTQRIGQYRVQPGTEDGFAPGP